MAMKILVIHDNKGQIKAVAAPSKEKSAMSGLKPGAGEEVSVIWTAERDGIELHQHLADLMTEHRIERSSKGPRLVRTGPRTS